MDFSQFCAHLSHQPALLQKRVDACAGLGRSYEFSPCRMPPGCRPGQTGLGFWRDGTDYLLYFRPAVDYSGDDLRLRRFFSQGSLQRFPGFQPMADCLQALGSAAAMPASFQTLNQYLQRRVLGQERAVMAAAFKLWAHACKREPLRPLSLILYGPTGVGKSELGKAIAPALNHCTEEGRYRLVWTELNTFTQAHSTYRLTGAPPGYVGYDDPPVLEAVRRCPHTVFMFDELDKAHPEVLKVFMSILDEGRCTARQEDSQGSRELDFRRCIFLFTTNTDLSGARRLGFAPAQPPPAGSGPAASLTGGPADLARQLFQSDETARQALARSGVLREITGRFSGLVGFQPLDEPARVAITAKQITALAREYGLNVVQTAPHLARALTPRQAVSPRSSVPMLEGVLSPVFLACPPSAREQALCLSGSVEHMYLAPVQT
ncbi:MAG: ATP-dependent Clp protease ATP-binding subunit [Oscillospiraceae bacterium]|jgi:hypothetical protein|nr:ATP-dependent Clp protease ATP-binding subunit [Oscillospiraceae bacterium]